MRLWRLRNHDIKDGRLADILDPERRHHWLLWDPSSAFNLNYIDGVGMGEPEWIEKNRAWGVRYEDDIRKEADGVFLMRPGFLHDYSRYILNDWNLMGMIPAANSFEQIASLEPSEGKLLCAAFLECTDGAYWEVGTKDELLWETLLRRLPDGEVRNASPIES